MDQSLTPPLGFSFAAAYAGLRKETQNDLALMVADKAAAAAGVFTQNAVRAYPVVASERALSDSGGRVRAILCNAGNANCATANAKEVVERSVLAVSSLLDLPPDQVLVCSTGVIGEPLDVGKIEANLPKLRAQLVPDNFEAVARAILTTDTKPKTAAAEVKLEGGTVRIAGMAKGSGMIQPNMATMLAYLFTDADFKPRTLRRMLKRAVDVSFNAITVDSDTSTNDTCLLLASGASGLRPQGDERDEFERALTKVCESLAKQIVGDGEGASKLLAVYVDGARNDKEAKRIAREIANSPLVKTALAGEDPNWGRILPAAGKAGVAFYPEDVDIFLNGFRVCAQGLGAEFDEAEVQQTMREKESVLRFHIRGGGGGQARFWTCDLTADYVRINADYRT